MSAQHGPELCSLFFLILIQLSQIASTLVTNWTTGTSSLPESRSSLVSGYNSGTHKIWMIGGWKSIEYTKNIFEFDVETLIISSHGNLSFTLGSGSQSYCSIEDIIYFNSHGDLGIFNMTSGNATYPWPAGNANQSTLPTYVEGACQATNERYLFIIGGNSTYIPTDVAEDTFQIYDIYTGSWLTSLPNLLTVRRATTCEVVNGYLYVFGGRGENKNYLDTIEKIDISDMTAISSKSWTMISVTLSSERSSLRSAVIGGYIFIVGGFTTGSTFSNTVEMFDTSDDSLSTAASLSFAVVEGSLVAVNAKLYFFGGYDKSGSDGVTDKWQYSNQIPTMFPSLAPTYIPSYAPTYNPSYFPTNIPSYAPTNLTAYPTHDPSAIPILIPSLMPTQIPSSNPSLYPTPYANSPTLDPTTYPTASPQIIERYNVCTVTFEVIVYGVNEISANAFNNDQQLSNNFSIFIQTAIYNHSNGSSFDIEISSYSDTATYEYGIITNVKLCFTHQSFSDIIEINLINNENAVENEIVSNLKHYFLQSETYSNLNLLTLKVEIVMDDETKDSSITDNISLLEKYVILFIAVIICILCCLISVIMYYIFNKRRELTLFVNEVDCNSNIAHGSDLVDTNVEMVPNSPSSQLQYPGVIGDQSMNKKEMNNNGIHMKSDTASDDSLYSENIHANTAGGTSTVAGGVIDNNTSVDDGVIENRNNGNVVTDGTEIIYEDNVSESGASEGLFGTFAFTTTATTTTERV